LAITNGGMRRKEVVDFVQKKQYEFPYEYLPEFLEYHQITESEFYQCADKYRNLKIWHKKNGAWRLKNELY